MMDNQSERKVAKLISRRIRFFRNERRMGRQLLADRAGLLKDQITDYERCKRSVAADHLFAISKALDLDIVSFFPSFNSDEVID